MKPEVAHRDAASQRHAEGLDRAIEILVIDRVFIMPDAGGWVGHLVGNERQPSSRDRARSGLMVAPVQALMAGVVRTVDPTGEKVKLVVPLTLKRR